MKFKNFNELDIVEKKSLPKEYGGTTPMKELRRECSWRQRIHLDLLFFLEPLWDMMDDFHIHMKYDEMHVDEKMYLKACSRDQQMCSHSSIQRNLRKSKID